MFYALVDFLVLIITKINQIRKEYNPQVNFIDSHITLVFPIKGALGRSLKDGWFIGWSKIDN
jgi:hypothetical protein